MTPASRRDLAAEDEDGAGGGRGTGEEGGEGKAEAAELALLARLPVVRVMCVKKINEPRILPPPRLHSMHPTRQSILFTDLAG